MVTQVEESAYLSFFCPACHQEIAAPADQANRKTECPACAAAIQVPAVSAQGTLWAPQQDDTPPLTPAQIQAMKSRTIRIELPEW